MAITTINVNDAFPLDPAATGMEVLGLDANGDEKRKPLDNILEPYDTSASVDQKVKTEKDRAEGVEGKLREDLTEETRRAKEAEQANAQAIETINNARGTANGIATLDSEGHVPASQLPSYVDDVLEFQSASAFPRPGESGKIYVALDTNKSYRWGGSDYTEISKSPALGETSSTAYPGDKGKKNAEDIASETRRATQAEGKLAEDLGNMIVVSAEEPTAPGTELWAQETDEPDPEVCPEAPKDDKTYGRKNGGWHDVVPKGGYMRELYESMPNVVFNPDTGMYDVWKEQGGISVTEAEMATIYTQSIKVGDINNSYLLTTAKALIPVNSYGIVYSIKFTFEGSAEFLCLYAGSDIKRTKEIRFFGGSKLRTIVDRLSYRSAANNLSDLYNIENIKLVVDTSANGVQINLSNSSKINYTSLRFVPDNVLGTTYSNTTTITLHATPYALLTGTAGDGQYTATGHTKEEWQQIVTDSTAKGITFTKAL